MKTRSMFILIALIGATVAPMAAAQKPGANATTTTITGCLKRSDSSGVAHSGVVATSGSERYILTDLNMKGKASSASAPSERSWYEVTGNDTALQNKSGKRVQITGVLSPPASPSDARRAESSKREGAIGSIYPTNVKVIDAKGC